MASIFLSYDEVLLIHADQIGRYGGDAGVGDLLRSALAQPEAMFDERYLHESLAEQAASNRFSMKRTASPAEPCRPA